MLAHNKQTRWSVAPDWVFHHHVDQTCTAYNPYSGVVLALSEPGAWVLQQLEQAGLPTETLELALAKETESPLDDRLRASLEGTLTILFEDARVIALSADS